MSKSQQADLLIIMISVEELKTDGDINVESEIQTGVQKLLEENLKVSLNLCHSSLDILLLSLRFIIKRSLPFMFVSFEIHPKNKLQNTENSKFRWPQALCH